MHMSLTHVHRNASVSLTLKRKRACTDTRNTHTFSLTHSHTYASMHTPAHMHLHTTHTDKFIHSLFADSAHKMADYKRITCVIIPLMDVFEVKHSAGKAPLQGLSPVLFLIMTSWTIHAASNDHPWPTRLVYIRLILSINIELLILPTI